MIEQSLYLKDGILFANKFNRVVHGERGDYIELEKDHIVIPIYPKFHNKSLLELIEQDCYYEWNIPENHSDVKIYFQLRTVKYADYKIGKYYISPDLLLNFKDPEKLF